MPSTAEIIQKCLNINPFDLKFREANQQITGQTPEQASGGGLPTTPSGIMIKNPSSLGQSPSVMSAADLECELRKNLDFTRKIQQVGNIHKIP
jgi:hypothetical protein